jgi:rhomboid protease GluP
MSSGPDWSAFPPPRPVVRARIPQAAPRWSYVILVLNGLAFVATFLLGREFVLGLGAKINQAIVDGQLWRLVTAMFLHVDLFHIGFNSYALLAFGPQVERPYGQFRFLLMYSLSGLGGSALSFLLSPYPSVGASGAIFGLIGVMGAYLYRYRDRIGAGRTRLTNLIGVAAYNLFYGFVVPSVDNWGHIGGLLVGLVLGWFLAPRYEVVQTDPWEPPRVVDRGSRQDWLWGVVLVVLGIGLTVAGGMLRWGR